MITKEATLLALTCMKIRAYIIPIFVKLEKNSEKVLQF